MTAAQITLARAITPFCPKSAWRHISGGIGLRFLSTADLPAPIIRSQTGTERTVYLSEITEECPSGATRRPVRPLGVPGPPTS
jgi:hypothetical protein